MQDEETGQYRQRMSALNTYCTANNLSAVSGTAHVYFLWALRMHVLLWQIDLAWHMTQSAILWLILCLSTVQAQSCHVLGRPAAFLQAADLLQRPLHSAAAAVVLHVPCVWCQPPSRT
jgi:hypothetical protein